MNTPSKLSANPGDEEQSNYTSSQQKVRGNTPPLCALQFPPKAMRRSMSGSICAQSATAGDCCLSASCRATDDRAACAHLDKFSASTIVEPHMSIIFPDKGDSARPEAHYDASLDALEKSISMREGVNFGRTHVRVEGYFQGDEGGDDMTFLIPNDLPRSTFLYVLTASEGRDKMFKCIQCTLHLLICLFKQPLFLPMGSQEVANYWAERFWRNANTIRHGRHLFRLGRWVLNVFYLQEVYERLMLKHEKGIRKFLNSLKASLLGCIFPSPTGTLLSFSSFKQILGQLSGGSDSVFYNGANQKRAVCMDDLYEHTARVEQPRSSLCAAMMQKLPVESEPLSTQLPSAVALHQRMLMEGYGIKSHDDSLNNTSHLQDSSAEPAGTAASQKANYPNVGAVYMSSSPLFTTACGPQGAASTPPSLYPDVPGSYVVGVPQGACGRQGGRQSTLLQPLCPNSADEDSGNSNDATSYNDTTANSVNGDQSTDIQTQRTEDKRNESTGDDSFAKNVVGSSNSYFNTYQTLPYEPRLGDALPPPRDSEPLSFFSTGKAHAARLKTARNARPNYHGNGTTFEEAYTFRPRSNEGVVSLSSQNSDSPRADVIESREEDVCAIPADMGRPAHWRKRILQFSTRLVLLLGVRSVATIVRRLLRDILLLSSENFLNFSLVEKNRPSLQRCTHKLWLVVASIDVLLNTIRLLNPGWYKYSAVRDSMLFRCNCAELSIKDPALRYRELVNRRQKNLFFPPVDLDFGVPICSSPAYFEAADPKNIAPACNACGCLFVETRAAEESQAQVQNGGTIVDKHRDSSVAKSSITKRAEFAILFIPLFMRKLFNYIWLLRSHPNWTGTILLQVSYMSELYVAFMYCCGGYETGKSDAALHEMLHPSGALAGLMGAVIGIYRVIQSAP
uniref:Uncharacterized protein n=1 Tax=Trypanosoma vivax (strain Y486) TaxID=1055687 RepID=G0U116_TRYVY|nr:conserved hypothetical protein [Trypanosoma vivax Y486]